MSSRCLRSVACAAGLALLAAPARGSTPRVLRVCADPNNLPFSNRRGDGFENRIAALVAREMHARLEYTWMPQRRGFFRNTLKAGRCDVVIGVPSGFELAATTVPYYRSTYVFVYRLGHGLDVRSLDDSVLRRVRVGVQLAGDDGANPPAAHALAARGITHNVVGFMIYGDYRRPDPAARIVDAVAAGAIDVAIVWGPQAGFYARRAHAGLTLVPVSPQIDLPYLPFVFDISMGVRRGDTALQGELDGIIRRRRASLDSILAAYAVPRADLHAAGS
jgi:mxaJ protein